MRPAAEPKFDVSSYLTVGARDYQEDALATEFAEGADFGIAVLADGMGGHAAGDVASRIVVDEVFKRLTSEATDIQSFSHQIHDILDQAAARANAGVAEHAAENPEVRGMGATLVATVVLHNLLYWISIGDSPLYLYRDTRLRQLNEDHSMAPQIDLLVSSGLMDPEVGRNHPDRSALTSVVIGGKIDRIDLPREPFRLEKDDIVIQSSDGLQYLSDVQIETVLASCAGFSARQIVEALGEAIEDLDHPEQDNVGFTVIRVLGYGEEEELFEIAWEEEIDESIAVANADAPSEEPSRKASGGGA